MWDIAATVRKIQLSINCLQDNSHQTNGLVDTKSWRLMYSSTQSIHGLSREGGGHVTLKWKDAIETQTQHYTRFKTAFWCYLHTLGPKWKNKGVNKCWVRFPEKQARQRDSPLPVYPHPPSPSRSFYMLTSDCLQSWGRFGRHCTNITRNIRGAETLISDQ